MRRSISLSPIRTESGANLRTANWTKLKFKGPSQNRNYNNYGRGGYQNYNRGYHNQRYQNRGRGYNNYHNQNWNRNTYVPKRRPYIPIRREESHSRSRSYSRSRSRDRSHSRHRYSYSRSRSPDRRSRSPVRQQSRSISREKQDLRVDKEGSSKATVRTEASSFYSNEASKGEIDFPEKVATNLGRWESPGEFTVSMQNLENMQKIQGGLEGKMFDAAEMQKKMKKTALESVARHEKSLRKIRKSTSKWENDSENSDIEPGMIVDKKRKKSKKKKIKSTKSLKKSAKEKALKQKVIEISESDSSNSSSNEKSSDSGSSSSSPVRKKPKTGKKKRQTSTKSNPSSNADDAQATIHTADQPPAMYAYPQNASSQPVMMMAPASGMTDMKIVGPYGQPVNLIRIEMPGPDGKMMQFFQVPSVQQGAAQPVVVAPAQPVPAPVVPQPVAAPEVTQVPMQNNPLPAHVKVVPIEEGAAEDSPEEHSSLDKTELIEKQKRRKEVIRTRLWPRPASSNWSNNDNKPEEQDHSKAGEKFESEWPLRVKDDGNVIPGFDFTGETEIDLDKNDIPGLSPNRPENVPESGKIEGQKIPTLGGAVSTTSNENPSENKRDNVVATAAQNVTSNVMSYGQVLPAVASSSKSLNQQTVAYPQIVQAFKPVFSGVQPPSQDGHPNMDKSQQPDHRWTAAAEEFIHQRDKLQPSSSDGEYSSSSDEFDRAADRKQEIESKKVSKQKLKLITRKDDGKKQKKKKKNKKERKISVASEDMSSPALKEKKRKKKKKNKDKDLDDLSESESRKGKKSKRELSETKNKTLDGDLERNIPPNLPLSHIRGLVLRTHGEGSRSIFCHVKFAKAEKQVKSKRSHGSYEDQFVSLFQNESDDGSNDDGSPLLMSKKSLKKIKIKSQGTRNVMHMTKVTLSERFSVKSHESDGKYTKAKGASQKVSVNLASLANLNEKFDKGRSPSSSKSPPKRRSPSVSPHKSPSERSSRGRSPSVRSSRTRSSKLRSVSPGRYRSRSGSRSSGSSRGRSRSRSKSLPKAYSMDQGRRFDDRRVFRRDGNRYQNQQPQYRYNQRFQHRGNYNNYNNYNRGRGNYYNNNNRGYYNNNRGYYNNNNRGYYNHNNRGRGYYNNNNNRDRQQQWRPNYRDRRDSERSADRSYERRSRSYSRDRRRESSYSSEASDSHARTHSNEKSDTIKNEHRSDQQATGASSQETNSSSFKRKRSPALWTHDKFEENDSDHKEE